MVSVHHKLGSDSLAVSLRSCSAVNYENKDTKPITVNSFEGMREAFALALGSLSIPVLHEACVWEGKSDNAPVFKKGTFPQATPSALVQKIEQSLLDKEKLFADDVMPLVSALQAPGRIISDRAFTETGMVALMVKQRIGSPTPVFSKGLGKTLDEMSMWELYRRWKR